MIHTLQVPMPKAGISNPLLRVKNFLHAIIIHKNTTNSQNILKTEAAQATKHSTHQII